MLNMALIAEDGVDGEHHFASHHCGATIKKHWYSFRFTRKILIIVIAPDQVGCLNIMDSAHPSTLATRVFELVSRLGVVRVGLLFASFEILLSLLVGVGLQLLVIGNLHWLNFVRPILFGMLISPWLAMFFTYLIKALGESRERLRLAHEQTKHLNVELKKKVEELNSEISHRQLAEDAKQQAIRHLQREVAEHKATQRQLRSQATLLINIVNSSPDLIYYHNKEGNFSGCNPAFEKLVGKKRVELVGKSPYDVYPEDIAKKVVDTDTEVLNTGKSVTYEQWMTYPNGTKVLFEFRKVPFVTLESEQLGLLAFGRDVTESRRTADAIEKAARDKTTFLSTISHELRTPLNGIIGICRILRDTPLTEEQENYLSTVYLSAVALGNIFNDIIDLDKIDRKRLEIASEPVSLRSLLNDLKTLATLMCLDKHISFLYEEKHPLPDRIIGDATRLRQVLWNMIGNAVKFTEQGYVKLIVDIEQQDDHAELSFAVEDTGVGIAPEEQQKIFAMYYQAKHHGHMHAAGTGIGLAVARHLVKCMGGDIHVVSDIGSGSRFDVHLPVQIAASEAESSGSGQEWVLPPLRALLVEDIELNVMVARTLLQKLSVSVDVAMTGAEALRKAEENTYDVVFLDIQLPDMDGFAIADKLRASPHSQDWLLVALTANAVKNRDEYLQRGMDDVVTKPIDPQRLKTVLSHFAQTVEPTAASSVTTAQEATVVDVMEDDARWDVLDIEFLEQMMEALGPDLMMKSIDMFRQVMPEYISVLDSNMLADDMDGVAAIAHKIKGAAGSVGLKQLQKVSAKAQDRSRAAWRENLPDWLEEIKQYETHVEQLCDWLNQPAA